MSETVERTSPRTGLWWECVDGDDWEYMIRWQSFSHWGMIETDRTEIWTKRFGWLGAA